MLHTYDDIGWGSRDMLGCMNKNIIRAYLPIWDLDPMYRVWGKIWAAKEHDLVKMKHISIDSL